MTFGRNIQKDSRTEFVCFSFHVGLLFINFSSFKPDTENVANFDAVASKITPTLTRCNFLADRTSGTIDSL